eukprot:COSAG03_NODE_3799_length_1824_cov_8.102029_1_plen_121_part_10
MRRQLLCTAAVFATAALQTTRHNLALAAPDGEIPAPVHLRVEGLLETPIVVISEPKPHFSFLHGRLPGGDRGVTQASYRLTVSERDPAAGSAAAPPLWDTGAVASANCSEIEYAGPALSPF